MEQASNERVVQEVSRSLLSRCSYPVFSSGSQIHYPCGPLQLGSLLSLYMALGHSLYVFQPHHIFSPAP